MGQPDHRGVDVQFPWELEATPKHSRILAVPRFFLDRTPVTCSEYAAYLEVSKYVAKDTHNHLKNWQRTKSNNSVTPPAGYHNKPVAYLSLTEARAYCAFQSKRLPHT